VIPLALKSLTTAATDAWKSERMLQNVGIYPFVPTKRTRTNDAADALRRHGVLRPRDVAGGVSRTALGRLVEQGQLERVGRGLYVPAKGKATEHHTLVEAATRVPHGVVCLLSALHFHGLTTQSPHEVWLAIDVKARKPKADWPPLRVVRFSGVALRFGVEEHELEGVTVHVTSKEKTVADCFKYRNKIGLDVALEALRDFLRSKRRSVDALMKAAAASRVTNVMRPYLESLA
jgi:predicted transcriptional regulator of viral defense system